MFQTIRVFFKLLGWGFIFSNLLACHRPSFDRSIEPLSSAEPKQPVEIEATPIVYSESELLRGNLTVRSEDGKTLCPAVLVTKNLVVLPRTCEVSETTAYSLHATHPKTRETVTTISHLNPVATNSLSQAINFQPRDYFLIYEVQNTLPDWTQPIRLLPPGEVARAFNNRKSLLILTVDGVRTIKAIDLKVERFYIYPYVTQQLPPENLLLTALGGRLYLTGSAKMVGHELFWVNLSSFTMIQELLVQP